MALQAPTLSHNDLREELGRFHRDPHRSLNTAFFGRGEPGSLVVRVAGEDRLFRIAPAPCELSLREALSGAEAAKEPIALLVDYTERLPLDVQGRLAKGNLQYISRERRLANLFGARAVSPALLESPLADALLRESRPFSPPLQGGTVDEGTAWRRQLERLVGLSSIPDMSEELVVAHFATEPVRAEAQRIANEQPSFAQAVAQYLRKSAGPVAELGWERWLVGQGVEVAALAFVLQALQERAHDGYVRAFLEAQLEATRSHLTPDDTALLERWANLAAALELRLGDSERSLARVLQEADRMVSKPGLQPHLAGSRHLTGGLSASKNVLAQALTVAAAGVGQDGRGDVRLEDVRAAIEAYQRLIRHRLASAATEQPAMDRALMAVRLVAYLALRPDWEQRLTSPSALDAAYEIAEHYAEEGGYVDYARRRARGGAPNDVLDLSIQTVLAAVDRYRDDMDVRFARGLSRWNIERTLGRLIPIEKVLDSLAIPFVEERPERRLLVLLMDGMAWATAAEILLDVREAHYAPLRWQPKHSLRSGLPSPMVAALPTVTEVSRAALFAGKLPKPGEKLGTGRDPERLQEHKGFVKSFGVGPRLLLRGEAEDTAGHITAEGRALVRSEDRVVAVVVNAVDDQLTSKPGLYGQYGLKTIKALQPLLDEARTAGRAVLLLADHGHVLSERPRDVVTADNPDGPRYREVAEGAPISDRELVLEGPHAFCHHKTRKLALLIRETDRYRNLHHVGEHGGASLAEIVTPALLIAAEDLHTQVGDGDDEGLQTVAFPVTSWWQLELPAKKKPSTAREPERAPKSSRKPTPRPAQLDLLTPAPSPPPPKVATRSEWSIRVAAEYSKEPKVRRAQLEQHVLPALDTLLDHTGRMSIDLFASQCNLAARQVGGLVAIMGEFLNLDGYEVVRVNNAAAQVELNQDLLADLFGERP